MKSIYVLGSINMDLVFEIRRMPGIGETMPGERFMMSPGGKGANQAVASSLQGVDIHMVASLGDDALSDQLQKTLDCHRVDTTHIERIPSMTPGVAGIFVEAGDNRIIIDSGANAHQSLSAIQSIIKNAPEESILLSQLEIPMEAVEAAFVQAKDRGMRTILNAAPARKLAKTLYSATDCLVVNEGEALSLSGVNVRNAKDAAQAAKVLMDKGARSVLFTLGDKGSLYIDRDETIEVPAYTVEVKDTTAAGDTFIGVFAAALAQESSIKGAMRRANAGAALTVQSLGAQVSIPSKEAIDTFIKTHTTENED